MANVSPFMVSYHDFVSPDTPIEVVPMDDTIRVGFLGELNLYLSPARAQELSDKVALSVQHMAALEAERKADEHAIALAEAEGMVA